MEEEIANNDLVSLIISVVVITANSLFWTLWLYRMIVVTFRLSIEKLQKLKICIWLKYVDIYNYEQDLQMFVEKDHKVENQIILNNNKEKLRV